MTLDAKVSLLKKSFLFADLDRSELEEIAQSADEVFLPAHTLFIHEADEADAAYIIDSGTLKIYTINEHGKEIPLNIAGHGATVGEMAILDGGLRSANVETLTDVRMLKLPKSKFQSILLKNPPLSLKLLSILSKKIRSMDENFVAIHTNSTLQLAHTMLKTLAKAYASNEIPLTHEELAQLIGSTRPRVTEALHELEKRSLIETSSKKIILIT